MSGIARILLARGVRVSGSDRRDTPTLLALRALGARVEVGHDAGPPRRRRHRRRLDRDPGRQPRAGRRPASAGLRVLPRAVALAAVMAGRRSIAVAGTHGKTSTTSMLDRRRPGLRRRPVVRDRRRPQRVRQQRARRRRATSSSPRPTRATAPSCCSPRSAAIVTNVEADHLDNYGDLAAVEAAFDRFLRHRRPATASSSSAPTTPGAARLRGVADAGPAAHLRPDGRTPTCG